MQRTAAATIATFSTSTTQLLVSLNQSLTVANQQSVLLLQKISTAQSNANATFELLLNDALQAEAEITTQLIAVEASYQATLAALNATRDDFIQRVTQQTAAATLAYQSSVTQLNSTRDDFVQRIVPNIEAQLIGLNQTASINQISGKLDQTNAVVAQNNATQTMAITELMPVSLLVSGTLQSVIGWGAQTPYQFLFTTAQLDAPGAGLILCAIVTRYQSLVSMLSALKLIFGATARLRRQYHKSQTCIYTRMVLRKWLRLSSHGATEE